MDLNAQLNRLIEKESVMMTDEVKVLIVCWKATEDNLIIVGHNNG